MIEAARRGPSAGQARIDTLSAAILDLQRMAGNQAVSGFLASVQRGPLAVGWSHPSKEGRAWNVGQTEVGDIHRIPLEGLDVGLKAETAKKGGKDKAAIPELSSESAPGKAIVLVPKAIKAPDPDAEVAEPKIDVVIFLHGHTEDVSTRPYAGWRALNPEAGKWKGKGDEDFVHSLRHGLPDEAGKPKDTAPVRDVALDEAEQQLQDSGNPQTIMVLPQGGLRSNFGDINPRAYANKVIGRLKTVLNTSADPDQILGRITMGGHSGAGATLATLAQASVDLDNAAKKAARKAAKAGKPVEAPTPTASPPLTGDLVIFDAIYGTKIDWQYGAFRDWALMRLNNDLAALKGKATDAEKEQYLREAPKLRGYYSTDPEHGGSYVSIYVHLQGVIDDWFKHHADELGHYAGCLRENFNVDHPVPVSHEELMRGVKAGESRDIKVWKFHLRRGSILDALQALDPKAVAAGATCPPLPASAQPDKKSEKRPEKRKSSHEPAREEEKVPVGSGH
jgi:hypothetical protein